MKKTINFTHRLGVTSKALAVPAFLVAVLIIMGGITLIAQQSINSQMRYISKQLAPASESAANLTMAFYQERIRANNYLNNPGVDAVTTWEEAHEATRTAIKKAQEVSSSDQDSQNLQKLTAKHQDFGQAFNEELVPLVGELQVMIAMRMRTLVTRTNFMLEDIADKASSANQEEAAITAWKSIEKILQTHTGILSYLTSRSYGANTATSSLVRVRSDYDAALDTMEKLAQQITAPADAATVQEVTENWSNYGEVLDALTERAQLITEKIELHLDTQAPEITALSQSIRQEAMANLNRVSTEVTASSERLQTMILIGMTLGTLLGALVAWLLTRSYVGPLVATNQFVRKLVGEINAGQGDLTQRIQMTSQDEVGELGRNINLFVETLQKVIGTINEESKQLTSSSDKLSSVAERAEIGVGQQKEETEQVATAINQMAATVQEIARSTSEASVAAQAASQESGRGAAIVQQTLTAINNLVEAVHQGQVSVDQLGKDSEDITSIVDVIQGVAEQTNLLSLNAAIEAARAGEDGRGFAVVATEVRNLAHQTQASTVEIQQLIAKLQQGAEAAIATMRACREQAGQTLEQAAEAGGALERIERKVQMINNMNAQIATASEEQTATTQGISTSVEKIRSVAEDTAKGTQQTSHSGSDLKHLAGRLNKLVNSFRS
ncbi:methyl-accepting chemotaxis protein [Marinospirillum sp.]|uniref:methyl-accepting chemotaxis protein n=1 Tax=Marinospirillum sp. TaxID=2183934 RepID=UPI00286FE654|nr:methyl-accepting chemotaxis protein [Marinospirillum sp.]MDR9467883.1 methyl-accepting chemotaxis protein [Marinospirillum sp.]